MVEFFFVFFFFFGGGGGVEGSELRDLEFWLSSWML